MPEADETIITRFLVEADDAITKIGELDKATQAVKAQLLAIAQETRKSFGTISKGMQEAFGDKQRKELDEFKKSLESAGDIELKGLPAKIKEQTAEARTFRAAMTEALKQINDETKTQRNLIDANVKAHKILGEESKKSYQGASQAAVEYRKSIEQIKTEIQSIAQQQKVSFADAAKGLVESGRFSATQVSTALKEVKTGTDQASSGLGRFLQSFSGLGAIISFVSGLLGVFAFSVLRNLIRSLGEAVEAGNELIRSFVKLSIATRALQRRGLDVTFSESVKQAEALREEFGTFSRKEAVEGIAQIQFLTRNFGFTNKQIEETTRLSAALAAVLGEDMGEEARKLSLFFSSGYAESLQRAGFAVNRLTVEQEIQSLGLAKNYRAATEQQRAQAALNLVLRQSSDLFEDAARIQDTLPGRYDKATASIDTATQTLGSRFVFLRTALQETKATGITAFADFVDFGVKNLITVTSAVAAFVVTLQAMRQTLREDIGGGFIEAAFVKPFQTLVSLLSRLKDFILSSFTQPIQEAGQAIDGNVVQPLNKIGGFIQANLVQPAQDFLNVLKQIGGLIDQYLVQPLKELYNLPIFQQGREIIAETLRRRLDFLTPLAEAFRQFKEFGTQQIFPGDPFGEAGLGADVALDDLEEKAQTIEDTYTKLRDNVLDIMNDYATKMRDLNLDLQRDLAKIDEDGARRREEINRQFAQRLADIGRDAQQAIAKERRDLANDLAKINRDLQRREEEARRNFRQKELEDEEKFQLRLKQLREDFIFDLEDAVRARDAKQIRRLTRQFNKEQKQLIDSRELEKSQRQRDFEQELEDLRRQAEERRAERIIQFNQRLEDIRIQNAIQRQEAEIAHQQELEDLNRRLAEQRADRLRQYNDQIRDLQRSINDRLRLLAQGLINENKLTQQGIDAVYQRLRAYFGPGGYVEQLYRYYQQLLSSQDLSFPSPTLPTGSPAPGGFAHGGTFIATRPISRTFGEVPELVSITPLNGLGRNAGKFFGDISGGDISAKNGKLAIDLFLSPDLEARIRERSMQDMSDVLVKVQRSR